MTTPVIEHVPVSALKFYPDNPRRHDIGMIAESLTRNGQYKPLIVQKSTRYVLAGNGTLEAAIEIGWAEIDALLLDIPDDLAKRIVLVDNRASDMASYSADDLAALLMSVDDLAGTGYSSDDLARLSGDLPEGFQPLDPDAPTPERDPVTCPACGHQWILGGLSRESRPALERAPCTPRRRCSRVRKFVRGRWREQLGSQRQRIQGSPGL